MKTTQFLATLPLAAAPSHGGTMIPLPLRATPPGLARRHDDARAEDRCRTARELQGELGARLLNLRSKVSCLRSGDVLDGPDGLPRRADSVLADIDIDAAIAVVRPALRIRHSA